MPILREAWSKGIIDEKTLVWGTGLIDWLPIRNVTLLTAAIRTPEGMLLDCSGSGYNLQLQQQPASGQCFDSTRPIYCMLSTRPLNLLTLPLTLVCATRSATGGLAEEEAGV